MADIFDQVAQETKGDIFDEVAASGKPSLSLGKSAMNEVDQFFQTPIKAMLDTAQAGAGAVLYPVSKAANWGTAAYGALTGDPNWKENAYKAEQTIQGLNVIPSGQELFGGEPSPIQQGTEILSATGKPAQWVKENAGYIPGEVAEQFTNYLMGRPLLKSKYFENNKVLPTNEQLYARSLANEHNLPVLPTTIASNPLAKAVSKITGPFKSTISPMFEKIRETIQGKTDEANTQIKGTIDNITSQFKTVDEQVAFKQAKGTIYDNVYSLLPESFELPDLKVWMSKEITKLKDTENKRPLSVAEANRLEFYERMHGKETFTPKDVELINGKQAMDGDILVKNPMPDNKRITARFKMYGDLTGVENGELAIEALKKTNKEYSLTTRSRLVTSFLEKVSDAEGNIDSNRWNRQYNNFKLNNATKMPKETMAYFENIDQMIRDRVQFKSDMENAFKAELQMYEQYKKNPPKSTFENVMDKVSGASLGVIGSSGMFPQYVGWKPAAIGAGILAAQKGMKGAAKSAVKPEGYLRTLIEEGNTLPGGAIPFELQLINQMFSRKQTKK